MRMKQILFLTLSVTHRSSSSISGLTSSSQQDDERQLLKVLNFRSQILGKGQLSPFLNKKTWKRMTRKSHCQPPLRKVSKAFYPRQLWNRPARRTAAQYCATERLPASSLLLRKWGRNGERKQVRCSPIPIYFYFSDTIIHRSQPESVPLHFQFQSSSASLSTTILFPLIWFQIIPKCLLGRSQRPSTKHHIMAIAAHS